MAKSPCKHKTPSGVEYEMGSGNVFADLGLDDPEQGELKRHLARILSGVINAAKVTQTKAAQITGISQPRISKIMREQLDDVSIDTLLCAIRRMGCLIKVTFSESQLAEDGTELTISVLKKKSNG